jgi:tetratricopeptide (TPR) repeat protein
MRVVPVAVTAACALVLCAGAQGQPGPLAEILRRGSALEERGEYGQAKSVYLAGLRQSPRSAEIHFRVGTIFLREGNWAEAIRSLQQARDIRPRHVDTLFYLAQAYYLDGQQGLAREIILRAVELAPERAAVAQKYGEYLCEAKLFRDGLRYLLEARRLDPALPNIDFDLGMAYHRQSAVTEARPYLEAALTKDPDNLVAARFLADILNREGDTQRAKSLYEFVVARSPQDAWALYGLGHALLALDRPEEALTPLRQALAADPTIGEAHFQLGRALNQLGRTDEGQRELYLFKTFRDRQQSLPPAVKAERTPFESRIWEECQRLLNEGREAEALAYLDSALAAERPNSPYLLGALYFTLGRGPDAVRMLARAATVSPEDADVLAFLGRAYLLQGEYDRAEETLAWARALAPDAELPLVGTGELEYARQHWDEAIRCFEQAKTTQVPALLKLVRSYLRANRRAKALEAAELVRAFGRGDPVALGELDSILASDKEPPAPAPAEAHRAP